MKLITYLLNDKEYVGIWNNEKVYPLPFADMNTLIESGKSVDELDALADKEGAVNFADIKLEAPIPVPKQDVICIGVNYFEHAQESAKYKREAFGGTHSAVYFSKRINRMQTTGDIIPKYTGLVAHLDYEAELGVVIAKDCKNLAKAEALDYVFGYTVMNDVSSRDLQIEHKEWYFGKSLDGFGIMGPCIVTADEFEKPPKLELKCYVNDELRQHSNTADMITGIDAAIHELSLGMTLKAGTIISTGTPSGVGMGFDPPKFLKSGDVVRCIVENVGEIVNTVE